MKVLFVIYQVLRSVRYSLLHTVFGMTIHCKHTPTCGTYLFRAMKSEGILKGGLKGLRRVLVCW
ncbi:membrane protein insertion efficiency factor YidD [Candidatus Woesebacteria bacterium]|nr:membrane protein insertion efficiency factor YidD [Candidatus Woesebacteria bacterium]